MTVEFPGGAHGPLRQDARSVISQRREQAPPPGDPCAGARIAPLARRHGLAEDLANAFRRAAAAAGVQPEVAAVLAEAGTVRSVHPLTQTLDHTAWISALSGHVATSPHGDRIWARTRNPHAGLAAGHVAANIEFHSPEYIGYARLRLRRDPAIGFVVMINTIHLHRSARGTGVGGSIVASWAERLRGLGIAEMQFEAVRDGHFTSGRLFWARDGVLFRDPGQPYGLLDRLGERDDVDARALDELRQRIDRGEVSTPADLYRDPLGRQALGADDWSGRWPLDG